MRAAIILCACALGSAGQAASAQGQFADKLLHGRAVQVALASPYYQDRSLEGIADEIAAAGFDAVHLVITSESADLKPGFVDLLHARGIGVWATLFATSVYTPTEDLPEGWEEWQVEFLVPQGYRHLSMAEPGYREWLKGRIDRVLSAAAFDGFTLYEPFFPVWRGLEQDPVQYADVSPAFQRRFMEATGHDRFPNFADPADPDFYETNPALYRDLVDYRAEVIASFFDELVNGDGGVRERRPEVLVSTWSVAAAMEDGLEILREWEGHDAAAVVERVKPDMHTLQTHWPDWIRPELPPDYARAYLPYAESVWAVAPGLPVSVQADIGSLNTMRKSGHWARDFHAASLEAGFSATTYYEFSLRWEVYRAAPELVAARAEGERAFLTFDQCVGPASAEALVGRRVVDFESGHGALIREVSVDGNRLVLVLDLPLESGRIWSFPVGGLEDDPARRFVPEDQVNRVPEDVWQWARVE
jgi:sugar phosphate isomerase/epimerase